MLELGRPPALRRALMRSADRVLFLFGSAASRMHASGGVPGVDGVVALARTIADQDGLDISAFDDAVSGLTGASRYAAALSYLRFEVDQDEVNKVIRASVRAALKNPVTAQSDEEAEGDPDAWHLPPAAAAVGQLLVSGLFTAPILTTNFDPLIEVGIRAVGGQPFAVGLDHDGAPIDLSLAKDGVFEVLHLHGYWRGNDTMHSPSQLTAPRPRLKATLQRMLQGRVLVAIGYGGWDDILMTALREVALDPEAELEVIWAFHEDEPAIIQARYSRLLEHLQPLIVRGRFRAYGGVDCHEVMQALTRATAAAGATTSTPELPGGWLWVDSHFLGSRARPLKQEELAQFFDGQVPSWRHGLSTEIPKRLVVEQILSEIDAAGGASSMHVLLGATAEGKSQALLQIAIALAGQDDRAIIWRNGLDAAITAQELAAICMTLSPEQQLVVVIDDAASTVAWLPRLVEHLNELDQSRIHVLAAARNTDWLREGGAGHPWDMHVLAPSPTELLGPTLDECSAVVAAWEAASSLGELSKVPNPAARAHELLKRSSASRTPDEGSLLGASLAVRYSAHGLLAHVADMMRKLQGQNVSDSADLVTALLIAAAGELLSGIGVDRRVLAAALEVPVEKMQSLVVRPLGREAVAVSTGRTVGTRHPEIGRAVILAAHRFALGPPLEEVFRTLVRETIKAPLAGERVFPHGEIVHGSTRVARLLPPQIARSRRVSLALAMADEAMSTEPAIGYLIELSRLQRENGLPTEALAAIRHYGRDPAILADEQAGRTRSLILETGVVQGVLKRPRDNLFWAIASLSNRTWGWVARADLEHAVGCIAVALQRLSEIEDEISPQCAAATLLLARRLTGVDAAQIEQLSGLAAGATVDDPQQLAATYAHILTALAQEDLDYVLSGFTPPWMPADFAELAKAFVVPRA